MEDIKKEYKLTKEINEKYKSILTDEALSFLIQLHKKFNPKRLELLEKREKRQQQLNQGASFSFLQETKEIREDLNWQVSKPPSIINKRWVELTGPTERKMLINALNSGADVFMADFEDANSPTWDNMVEGQINLYDAVHRTLSFQSPEGKQYHLNETHATLFVRPRGLHLNEKHLLIQGEEIAASFFDFGLYFFHNATDLAAHDKGPFFYLPKLESHQEARLWNEIFIYAQEVLQIPQGTIKATVLIETIPAAFEMEEILYELKEHSAGLNAGRWDYIFSVIKKFQSKPLCLPDREQVTMGVPFMSAYAKLLVHTCHKRGAHAIGGMSAFIPNRRDEEVTNRALKKVEEDKLREATDGSDGTWVAHPDLVIFVREIFEKKLEGKDNQLHKKTPTTIKAEDLLNFKIGNGKITEKGIRENIYICLKYLSSWFSGTGAVAIHHLMEDMATAEISRAQLWDWLHHKAALENGQVIDSNIMKAYFEEVINKFEEAKDANFFKAAELLEKFVFSEKFYDFLTSEAYNEL